MQQMRILGLVLISALTAGAAAQNAMPLKLVATIPLPGLHDGDFDHFTPDPDGHRLFLTGEENEKVLVFDTDANKLVHTIEDVKAPHAILYRKDLKKMFIVAGDASAVQVYDADSYKMGSEIKVSIDADSIAYDPATHYMYVVNGGREAHTPYSTSRSIRTTWKRWCSKNPGPACFAILPASAPWA
jgi:DNA-binding beta-propeller fold protein YncE